MQDIVLSNALLLAGAALVLMGVVSSLVAQRFGTPLLLIFLVIGMLVGQDGLGGIVFDNFQVAYLVGSLALAVILFDGGLRTRLASFRGVLAPAAVLATGGVLLTATVTGLFASMVLGISVLEGLLVGSVVASTDAAAVFFLLKSGGLRLKNRMQSLLEIESSTNDPIAVFLTILLVELLMTGGENAGVATVVLLFKQALIGCGIGLTGGMAMTLLLNRVALPSGLHPLMVVSAAVATFGLAAILDGSGFLAVYLAGLLVGNRPVRALPAITSFHDSMTWLCQIVMFIMLGLLVTPSQIVPYLPAAIATALFLTFIGRPAAVSACLALFGFSRREITFASWVGLRGAVSIFLAAIPTLAGLPNSQVYFNVAFVVVIVSLVLQGWTINPLARRLGLALPRKRMDVTRMEIDIPGQLEQEMVAYPVEPNSPIVLRAAPPRWARAVFVVRDDEILEPRMAGALRPGDYGYFLIPPDRIRELDRLFTPRSEDSGNPGARFPIRPDIALARVAEIYGISVPDDLREKPVAEVFADRFESQIEVGDHIEFNSLRLNVTAVEDGNVTGAELEIAGDEEIHAPALRRLAQRVRERGLQWRSRLKRQSHVQDADG